MTNKNILSLQPDRIWFYFDEILKIPRPSRSEEKIARYIANFGETHNLETITDDLGNVLIRKPATQGMGKKQMIALQSHMDMVCEKNSDVIHDFERDPINAYIDGEWVKAQGTTLGADCGIGVAAQLALLESDNIKHGPIECLFTVDEESGMTGAAGLDPGFLKSRTLLNLDSEDEGELFIGCAGGRNSIAYFPYQQSQVPAGHLALRIDVRGLMGGHSGDDINRGLGNANKIIVRTLFEIHRLTVFSLSFIDGGKKHNAIPREAHAIITVPAAKKSEIEKCVMKFDQIVRSEFLSTDPHVKITCEPSEIPKHVLNANIQTKFLRSLYSCPNGVIRMSPDLKDLVETSTNLASVKTSSDQITVVTSQRSSLASSLDDLSNMVKCNFLLGGAKVEQGDGYPGWKPDINSDILKICRDAYLRLFKEEPKVKAIHAGLECGLIGEKYPGMDMISFGPTVKGVHSPDERLNIVTVKKFWDYLLEVIKSI